MPRPKIGITSVGKVPAPKEATAETADPKTDLLAMMVIMERMGKNVVKSLDSIL